MRVAELAVAFKNRGVVGFDLAGAEYNNPAKLHREAFYLIRNNNINVTIHAGEAYGPESIHQSIHHCGAHRIGHGSLPRPLHLHVAWCPSGRNGRSQGGAVVV